MRVRRAVGVLAALLAFAGVGLAVGGSGRASARDNPEAVCYSGTISYVRSFTAAVKPDEGCDGGTETESEQWQITFHHAAVLPADAGGGSVGVKITGSYHDHVFCPENPASRQNLALDLTQPPTCGPKPRNLDLCYYTLGLEPQADGRLKIIVTNAGKGSGLTGVSTSNGGLTTRRTSGYPEFSESVPLVGGSATRPRATRYPGAPPSPETPGLRVLRRGR